MTQIRRADSHAIRSQDGRSPDPTITDGFNIQDLGAADEAPPAYGDSLDHLQLSQGGFEAGAAVTGGGLPALIALLPLPFMIPSIWSAIKSIKRNFIL